MAKKKTAIEERVAANEEKYRAMADRFVDAIWVIDAATLKYLYISPSTYETRGYTRHKDNTWWPLKKYVEERASSRFTHTICPDCKPIYYPKIKS